MRNNRRKIELHLFFAQENQRAIILMRYAKKRYHLMNWDTETDKIEHGDWIPASVYAVQCALSPDGKNFMYFALDGHWGDAKKGAYTAICNPPSFAPCALYPLGDVRGAGGHFLNNGEYAVNTDVGNEDIVGTEAVLRRVYPEPDPSEKISGYQRAFGDKDRIARIEAAHMARRGQPSDRMARYQTEGGQLLRVSADRLELIADFTDLTPPSESSSQQQTNADEVNT